MTIIQGSVSIASDGTETKSGAAGSLYDILKTTATAQLVLFGQAFPSGAESKPVKQALADVANDYAEWIVGQGAGAVVDHGTQTSSPITFDLGTTQHHVVTIGVNALLAFTNIPGAGTKVTLRIIQAAPGNFTATWPATAKMNATSKVLSTASGAHDIFVGESDGTNIYFYGVEKALA